MIFYSLVSNLLTIIKWRSIKDQYLAHLVDQSTNSEITGRNFHNFFDHLDQVCLLFFVRSRKISCKNSQLVVGSVQQSYFFKWIGLYKLEIVCAREEIHANLRKTSEDVGLSNQCTTTTCIQKCANFSSMEAAEAMPTSKNFSSKCHKTQCLRNFVIEGVACQPPSS